MAHSIEVEIDRNYAAFKDLLPSLLVLAEGKYALMRDQRLEGIFDTPGLADRAGYERFGKENYSIQLVSDSPVDLGFYSYAISQR
jgi:hypothetical protein